MLDVILQILSVVGTILLVLLILIIVLLLLVLFFPITYRFWGTKQEGVALKAKANWLFGLIRVCYAYPEPARLTVKVLWFTLYETFIPSGEKVSVDNQDTHVSNDEQKKTTAKKGLSKPIEAKIVSKESTAVQEQNTVEMHPEGPVSDSTEDNDSFYEKILKKIEQIKYTILGLCDKIKEIWENINYYVELLKEDDTKELFRHVLLRVGKILKSIRPRHLKADILYGTGSPDTTGYVYAVYGMLSVVLGPKFIVIPDFEQSVLKGQLQFSGHITIWILLINGLKLLFDKKLHRFIRKVKAGMSKKEVSDK